MAQKRITDLAAASALTGAELVEVSQRSAAVTITGATISATAADNSFSDSAAGFLTAGFAVGDRVGVLGFANAPNNLLLGVLSAVVAGKLTLAGVTGDAIVNEAAGAAVTIFKWVSRRTTAQGIADLAGVAAEVKYRFGFSIENEQPLGSEVLLRHVFTSPVLFADDFAGSRARLAPSGANPATAQIFSIAHNGAAVGTLTISSAGVITWATTGGTLLVAAGDELRVVAPSATDIALIGVSTTLFGTEQ